MDALKSFLHAPVFEDEEKNRSASLLYGLLLACLLGAGLYVVLLTLFIPYRLDQFLLTVVLVPVLLTMIFLVRSGFVRSTSVALVFIIGLTMTFACISAGGIQTPAFTGLIIPVLIGGFLLGRRAGISLTFLALAIGVLLAYLEDHDLLPPPQQYSTLSILITYALFFSIGTLLLNSVLASIRRTLLQAQVTAEQLAKNNQILQDTIAELKQTQAALSTSEQNYRQLFDSNPHPMWVFDRENLGFLAVNDAAINHYGYSRDEFLGMTIKDIRPLEDIPDLIHEVKTHADQPLNKSGIWRHRRKDGSLIHVQIASYGLEFKGRKSRLIAADDITEGLMAEEAVRRSEELFSNIFQTVPVAISITTLNGGRVLNVNRQCLDMLGYADEEVINCEIAGLGIWESFGQRSELIREVRETGCVLGKEAHWKTKSGSVLVVMVSMSLIKMGTEECVLVMALDITEQKRLQREHLDAERIRMEIYKEREVLALKETFISKMSHEFRTPLAVILGAKESLEHYYDRMKPERREEHFHNIDQQIHYVTTMLDEVLTLSKAQAGKLKFTPSRINLAVVCRKLYEQVQLTDSENHFFVWSDDDWAGEMDSDPVLLQHMLINLLSNAIKYSPSGSQIRLSVGCIGSDAIIAVSDQGIGIPEEDQKRLYEPFYRASNTGSIRGTGLGLAIVHESVQAHGGTIACQSAPGAGATFTVRLPIAYAH